LSKQEIGSEGGPKTRSFQNVTDADIVSQVAADHGFDTDIDPTREVHEYVLQSSESDYAFLRRRAERIGFDTIVASGPNSAIPHIAETPEAGKGTTRGRA
jgi:phage protein D